MSRCQGCNAETKWIQTLRGKFMLVDTPVLRYRDLRAGDNVVTEDGQVIRITHANEDRFSTSGTKYYRAHWATCEKAEEFRRPRVRL